LLGFFLFFVFLRRKKFLTYSFDDLIKLVARLTADDGCPWDKEQTHKSIRINMIEEAYEAVDAVDSGDMGALVEELGDVLLQPVLHADIARRAERFCIDDVVSFLYKKIYSRHTHIFGADKAKDAADALVFWENAKSKEKSEGGKQNNPSSQKKYPENFPAALRAEKVFKKQFKDADTEYIKRLLLDALNDLEQKNDDDTNAAGRLLFLAVGLVSLFGYDAEAELNNYAKNQ